MTSWIYQANSWSREQFREGLSEIISRERELLKSGERSLNKHKAERGRSHSFTREKGKNSLNEGKTKRTRRRYSVH